MARAAVLLIATALSIASATPTSDAIALANAGRMQEALAAFKRIAADEGSAQSFSNLCVTQMRLGAMQDAKGSCERAITLDPSNVETKNNYRDVLHRLGKMPAEAEAAAAAAAAARGASSAPRAHRRKRRRDSSCPADSLGRARCATELLNDGEVASAVRALCDVDAMVRVEVSEAAVAAGQLGVDEIERASAALRVCGAVVLTRAYAPAHVRALHLEQSALLDVFLSETARAEADGVSTESAVTVNSSSSAQRSPRRYEIRYDVRAGQAALYEATLDNGLVRDVLRVGMGVPHPARELEFDTLSHITSLPGAPTQHWHRDTAEQLYASLGGSSLLPPHCVTLFLPLVDLTPSLGPPQMLLGSHLPCDVEQRSTLRVPDDGGGVWVTERECSHIVSKPYKAVADAGAAILFDSRLMHRGGANTSPSRRRPMLYLTYARSWFRDGVNFHEPQTTELLAFESAATQKMLSRLDAREYVALLEKELAARGANVSELRVLRDAKPLA